jgi:hypothetical protein
MATLVTTALLVLAGIPSVSSSSGADPEITDPPKDVSPGSFLLNKSSPAANEAFSRAIFANASAYDVTAAWVALESQADYWMFIQVRDLPDGWGLAGKPPSGSPFGDNASFAGTSLVANCTIAGGNYRAIAKLAMPERGQLLDNYTLWKGDEWVPLSGAYSTSQDWVAMRLPKAAFAGLADGVKLTKFWVLGRYANFSMDFAPNAKQISLSGVPDPSLVGPQVAKGRVVEPQFGRDYSFGQYYHPPGPTPTTSISLPTGTSNTKTPSHVDPALRLEIVGGSQKALTAGHSVVYEVAVHNDAAASDTVFLVLSSASKGWSHQLSESTFVLPSMQARSVLLTVAASDGAVSSLRSMVDASSMLGASTRVSALSVIDGSVAPHTGSGGEDVTIIEAPKSPHNGTPGLEAFGVLAVLGLLAIALRGRGTR